MKQHRRVSRGGRAMHTTQVLGLSGPATLERVERDRSAPVLLLRSFQDDHDLQNFGEEAWLNSINPGGPIHLPISFEEALAALLSERVGPVVKIGGRSGLRNDVHRLTVSTHEWQLTVKDHVARAVLVLVHAGPKVTMGVEWELGEIVSAGRPARFLLIVAAGEAAYEQFRASAHHLFPLSLPPYGGIGFVSFGDNWEPSWLPIPLQYETDDAFDVALAPVFARIGVPATEVFFPTLAPNNTHILDSVQRSAIIQEHVLKDTWKVGVAQLLFALVLALVLSWVLI